MAVAKPASPPVAEMRGAQLGQVARDADVPPGIPPVAGSPPGKVAAPGLGAAVGTTNPEVGGATSGSKPAAAKKPVAKKKPVPKHPVKKKK